MYGRGRYRTLELVSTNLKELDSDGIVISLSSFCMNYGGQGFTNKEIRDYYGDQWDERVEHEWKLLKKRATQPHREKMFYEDGKWYTWD